MVQQTKEKQMLLKAFSIRDQKAEIFHPPFYKQHHGEAERDFQTACRDSKSNLSQYPEDFDLYYLGDYDDHTGIFKSLDTPQHMLKAIACVKKDTPKLEIESTR